MTIANLPAIRACRAAWNKGHVGGQKRPLMPKHVWAIRVRLEIAENYGDLPLFNPTSYGTGSAQLGPIQRHFPPEAEAVREQRNVRFVLGADTWPKQLDARSADGVVIQ